MSRIITNITNKESLTTKLTLIVVGLTAASGLLIPATYASFHPVTTGEIADNTILSVDIGNGQVRTEDIGAGQVRIGDIANDAVQPNIQMIRVVGSIGPNNYAQVLADCPTGTVVTGGGFWHDTENRNIDVYSSYPVDSDTWRVAAFNFGMVGAVLISYAQCIGPMP
jgi:hypothetical protein